MGQFQCTGLVGWIIVMARSRYVQRFLARLWGSWKWLNNMLFEDNPWSVEESWRRIFHDHDDFGAIRARAEHRAGSGVTYRVWAV